MAIKESFKARRLVLFSVVIAVFVLFVFFCRSVFVSHAFDPMTKESVSDPARISGVYYAQAAQHLQYHPHDPAQVHGLFRNALIHAPADANIFMSYFQYLMETDCCPHVASTVIKEAVARDPYSPQTLSNAIHFFLRTGQKQQALRYIAISAEVNPRRQWLVNELVKSDLTMEEVRAALPKTENGQATLKVFVEKRAKAPNTERQSHREKQ